MIPDDDSHQDEPQAAKEAVEAAKDAEANPVVPATTSDTDVDYARFTEVVHKDGRSDPGPRIIIERKIHHPGVLPEDFQPFLARNYVGLKQMTPAGPRVIPQLVEGPCVGAEDEAQAFAMHDAVIDRAGAAFVAELQQRQKEMESAMRREDLAAGTRGSGNRGGDGILRPDGGTFKS